MQSKSILRLKKQFLRQTVIQNKKKIKMEMGGNKIKCPVR